jgi:hypothetical protein
MGTLMGVMALFLVVAIVVAVIVSTRMGTGGRPSKDAPAKEKEYDDLYGDEPRRRKVRPVAKVDIDKVEVTPSTEEVPSTGVPEAPGYAAAAAAAGYAVTEEEPEAEPPLPSWMSQTKADEVHLEEKVVEPPPATPPEWKAPSEPAPDQPYKFRRPTDGQQVTYKGVGRPKQ